MVAATLTKTPATQFIGPPKRPAHAQTPQIKSAHGNPYRISNRFTEGPHRFGGQSDGADCGRSLGLTAALLCVVVGTADWACRPRARGTAEPNNIGSERTGNARRLPLCIHSGRILAALAMLTGPKYF
jgi:hypothetical protein